MLAAAMLPVAVARVPVYVVVPTDARLTVCAATRLPHGLSAFPLTPLRDDRLDRAAFVGLIERLVAAEVNSHHRLL